MNPEPHGAFQRHDQTPSRGPETYSSTPKGYPFKLKAVVASLVVTDGCAIPVFCGLALGADAPKFFPRLCRRPMTPIRQTLSQTRFGARSVKIRPPHLTYNAFSLATRDQTTDFSKFLPPHFQTKETEGHQASSVSLARCFVGKGIQASQTSPVKWVIAPGHRSQSNRPDC